MTQKSDSENGKSKRSIEDWDKMSIEEKKQLKPEEREELLLVFDEWFHNDFPKSMENAEKYIEDSLAEMADLDQFLATREEDVDILFLTQGDYLRREDFVQQVKKDLQIYVSYFEDDLSDDEYDALYDDITALEVRYKRLLDKKK